jgi:hypothetical protein
VGGRIRHELYACHILQALQYAGGRFAFGNNSIRTLGTTWHSTLASRKPLTIHLVCKSANLGSSDWHNFQPQQYLALSVWKQGMSLKSGKSLGSALESGQ